MAKRRLTSQDLLQLHLVGDVALSPDARRTAYVLQSTNAEQNRYDSSIYLIQDGGEPVRFTRGDSDKKPRFTPDGQHLTFLSKRSGQMQVWRIGLGGGEAEQLTRIHGGVREYAIAPDSSALALIAQLDATGVQEEHDRPETDLYKKHTAGVKVITERHFKQDEYGFYSPQRPQVIYQPLNGGVARALTQPPHFYSGLSFSPDGQTIYTTANREPDYDHYTHGHLWAVPVDGSPARRLTPVELAASNPSAAPDGKTVAFQGVNHHGGGYENTDVWLVNADGSGLRRLTAASDRTFSNVAALDIAAPPRAELRWTPDSTALYAHSCYRGTIRLSRVDTATGALTDVVAGDRVVYAFDVAPAAGVAVTALTAALHPGDLFAHDLRTGTERRLTQVNQALLDEVELVTPERFTTQAAGGPEVDGWVMKPVGQEPGRTYPALLEIHGGPMFMYTGAFFFEFQLAANQGYGVLYTNPRGSQSYGHDFCSAIRHEWGNRDLADIYAGLETALAQQPWIDPSRLGVAGGSYGGYMTNWIVGHTDRFKAAVSGRCVSDWPGMVASSDLNWTWLRRTDGIHPFGAEEHAWYRQQSPITYAERIVTPLLLEAQEGDLRCPVEQSEAMFTVVKALGKAPVRFVRYPDEFHGMSRGGKPWHRLHRLDEITAWFAQHLPPIT